MEKKISEEAVRFWTGKMGYEELTTLQRSVLQDCAYMGGVREFIMGSTSSGKTLIPLVCWLAAEETALREGEVHRLLYIVPYRALATQKAKDFAEKMPGKRIVVSTSEYCADDANVVDGNCDIAIVIYEKVFLFLSKNKKFYGRYSHIVFDELGIIENPERGLKADYILAYACKKTECNIYVLATPYFNWDCYIRKYGFHCHRKTERPVEIQRKTIVYEETDAADSHEELDSGIIDICRRHRKAGHKILIFANSRSRVKELAQKIAGALFTDYGGISVGEAKKRFLSRLVMVGDDLYGIMDDEDFRNFENGVAFHNASLPEEIRELVENEFLEEAGILEIVVATETLAYGLNSNVDVVIVADLEKPNGKEKCFLSVNEYENYVGRAGRLGKKDRGYAYTFVCGSDQEKKLSDLMRKTENPQIIQSHYGQIWVQKECIFHMLNYFDCKKGMEKEQVLGQLQDYPLERNNEKHDMETQIALLRERHLIREVEDELEDTEKLQVSVIGKRALGYIIGISTYDKLMEATRLLSKSKKLYVFDLLLTVCECEELQFTDYCGPQYAAEYAKRLPGFIQELHRRGEISDRRRREITSSQSLRRFMAGRGFVKRDWTELRKFRMAEALYRWINGYSAKEIQKLCQFEYCVVQKKGEKGKYITDILSADVWMDSSLSDMEIQFKRLGVALFYGVPVELLDRLDVTALEPVQGRQLRTIGRIINIKRHYSARREGMLKGLLEHIGGFPENYIRLLEETDDVR